MTSATWKPGLREESRRRILELKRVEEGYLDWKVENVEFHEVIYSDDGSSNEETVFGDGDGELARALLSKRRE